jgi:hypothetical protein
MRRDPITTLNPNATLKPITATGSAHTDLATLSAKPGNANWI